MQKFFSFLKLENKIKLLNFMSENVVEGANVIPFPIALENFEST